MFLLSLSLGLHQCPCPRRVSDRAPTGAPLPWTPPNRASPHTRADPGVSPPCGVIAGVLPPWVSPHLPEAPQGMGRRTPRSPHTRLPAPGTRNSSLEGPVETTDEHTFGVRGCSVVWAGGAGHPREGGTGPCGTAQPEPGGMGTRWGRRAQAWCISFPCGHVSPPGLGEGTRWDPILTLSVLSPGLGGRGTGRVCLPLPLRHAHRAQQVWAPLQVRH